MKRPKRTRKVNLYNDYYLQGSLTDQQIIYLDNILKMDRIEKLKHIIPLSAELFKREYEDIVLYDQQTKAVGMAYINPYFFIGDKPGLGKTIMSAAVYAQYRKKQKEEEKPIKKLLVITETGSILGFTYDYKSCGINLVPLYGGTKNIEKAVKSFNLQDDSIDGVITTWDSVKTNGFLMFYLEHVDELSIGVFDETSSLKNNKTILYDKVNKIADNMERLLFLNASPFETNIFDMFNQFAILNPQVIPVKKYIYENYVEQGRKSWFVTEYKSDIFGNKTFQRVQKFAYDIVGYKNQEDLKNRLRYYYIARTKRDYRDDIPSNMYILHPIVMTEKMKKLLNKNSSNYREIINSPTTINSFETFNTITVPKLQKVIELFEELKEDKPVIYCFNTEAQLKIKEELSNLGYKVEIISGKVNSSAEEREGVLRSFKGGFYDGLITNIEKAINIYGSSAMIFYDIPTNPQITYQVMGRIDRNNFTEKRQYHFLVYLESPEMFNMVDLAYFREENGSKFTGQPEDVYKQLIKQLNAYIQ